MRNPTVEEREEEIERRLDEALGDHHTLHDLMDDVLADVMPVRFDEFVQSYVQGTDALHAWLTNALKDEIGRQVDADMHAALEARARERYDEEMGA